MKNLIILLLSVSQAFAAPSSNRTLPAQFLKNGTSVLTLPSSGNDVILGRATVDTVTGKSISAATNTLTGITNTSISATAAIDFTKLATLTNGNILVGNVSNQAASVSVTGDISLSNAGVTAYSGTVPINKGGSGQTTANASLNAFLPSQTSNNLKFLRSDGTNTSWAVTGSGGGGAKNYLSAINGVDNGGDFEGNTVGSWVLGTATLTSALPTGVPTFGSGASGNLTGSIASSSQLSGNYSYSYLSSAATTAGNFLASPAFTVDTSDKAKVLTFKFNYSAITSGSNDNWSGTSSNSFGVAIYDVTAAAWIIPSGVWGMTQSSGSGIATGTFQTTSTSTQYRLVIFNANASSGATTLYFDDFSVSPQTAPIGAAMSDWTSWTPTGAWSSNTTYAGQWRRVGGNAEYDIVVTTSGAPTSANLTINLPTNHVIDTARLASSIGASAPFELGTLNALDFGVADYVGFVRYNNTTSVIARYYTGSATAGANVTQAAPFTFGASDQVHVHFDVPIAGWSSSVQMSQDTDTRVVAASLFLTSAVAGVTSGSPLKYDTTNYDTHAGYSVSTGLYTVPISGKYLVSVTAYSTSGTVGLHLNKNGVSSRTFMSIVATSNVYSGSSSMDLVAGDTLAISPDGTTTFGASTSVQQYNSLTITRVSGPSVVAATESVNARYTNTAGTSIANSGDVLVPFATKDYDTHSAFATPTFTVPVSGKYRVSAVINFATGVYAVADIVQASVYKNGAIHSRAPAVAAGSTTSSFLGSTIDTVVNCVAGDTLDVRVNNTRTAGATLLATGVGANHVEFERIGN